MSFKLGYASNVRIIERRGYIDKLSNKDLKYRRFCKL